MKQEKLVYMRRAAKLEGKSQDELCDLAAQYVMSACELLRLAGPKAGKVAWLLEDALGYLHSELAESFPLPDAELFTIAPEIVESESESDADRIKSISSRR